MKKRGRGKRGDDQRKGDSRESSELNRRLNRINIELREKERERRREREGGAGG